jgi:hypothetical protein
MAALVVAAEASPLSGRPPGIEDGADLVGDLTAGVGPGEAHHQQAVVRRVDVGHGGDHGEGDGLGVAGRPAALRPTRPLRRAPAWPAISLARSGGHPGNSWP